MRNPTRRSPPLPYPHLLALLDLAPVCATALEAAHEKRRETR